MSPVEPKTEDTLSLSLSVVNDTHPDAFPPYKFLEATLRNGLLSSRVWLEGRLTPRPGAVDLDLRDEHGRRFDEACRLNPAPSQPSDYMMLGPGDAITRLMVISCYDLPEEDSISVVATYENLDSDPPAPPLELLPLFRGPVVSNRLVFTLSD